MKKEKIINNGAFALEVHKECMDVFVKHIEQVVQKQSPSQARETITKALEDIQDSVEDAAKSKMDLDQFWTFRQHAHKKYHQVKWLLKK